MVIHVENVNSGVYNTKSILGVTGYRIALSWTVKYTWKYILWKITKVSKMKASDRDVNFMHNMPSRLNGHMSVARNTPVTLQCLCFRDSCSSKKQQRMSDPTKPTAKHNHLNIFSKD